MSGTNVHAILEEPPVREPLDKEPVTPVTAGPVAWVVSARTAEGQQAQARRLAAYLAARPELDPADVAWSLATTRSVFEHRAVLVGAGRDELVAGLAALATGERARSRRPAWSPRRAPGTWARSRSCSLATAASGRAWAGS